MSTKSNKSSNKALIYTSFALIGIMVTLFALKQFGVIGDSNSEIEVEIISESSELNYGTEELFIPSKIIFKGMYLNQPFTGEADEMNFYFLENRISFSKNLMLIFDEKEYKGQNIEINTKDKSIMGSDKISINKINDFKNKKDL